MTATTPTPEPVLATSWSGPDGPATRSRREHARALPAVLRSEWIKVSTVRSNKVTLGLSAVVGGATAWLTAVLLTGETITVANVFIGPTALTAVLAAVAGILLFSSEAQHGTLAAAVTAQPSRWVLVVAKTIVAAGFGIVLGAVGMAAGFAGATGGSVAMGDTSGLAATVLWALYYTALSGVLGLGVGMIVRHSAGAIAGLLVWWLVVESLVLNFLPAEIARFVPFDAGYRLLEVESEFDIPEIVAAALTRSQYALVFGAYAAVALIAGTALFSRRDTN
jgi:ABC-type transport system involved in multi-copper enzyme maturation permease subunit